MEICDVYRLKLFLRVQPDKNTKEQDANSLLTREIQSRAAFKTEVDPRLEFLRRFSILQFLKSLVSPRLDDSDEKTPLIAPELDAPLVRTKDEVNKEAMKRLRDLFWENPRLSDEDLICVLQGVNTIAELGA